MIWVMTFWCLAHLSLNPYCVLTGRFDGGEFATEQKCVEFAMLIRLRHRS